MPDHRFGSTASLSLGVEEELLPVDEAHRLVAASEWVLEAVPTEAADRVSSEIFSEQIELKTGICADVGEAREELEGLRSAVLGTGVRLIGSGLHPDAMDGARLVDRERYEVVRKDFGSLLTTPPCGLHVHVGAPDPETAIHLANAFRLYLPALQALSANSPFREGADSGDASARAAIVRRYPRFQMPRQFEDYAHFLEVADQLVAAAGVDDYTYIWWDVRPHPNLGTVEVRALDVAANALGSAAFAGLIQAIAARELDSPLRSRLHREALEESYFQAASHGLDAEILLDEETPRPARELLRRLLEEVGPYARELDAEPALEEVERVLRHGNGADDQRRMHAEFWMPGLLDFLGGRAAGRA
jgi:carboxylate-amine ligase